jgi:hypothetical protein
MLAMWEQNGMGEGNENSTVSLRSSTNRESTAGSGQKVGDPCCCCPDVEHASQGHTIGRSIKALQGGADMEMGVHFSVPA